MKRNAIHNIKCFNIRCDILICLYLVISILAVYWQTRSHEFVSFDDGMYVYNNLKVTAGLSYEGIRWAFTFTDIAYWHPLTWLSHMLDCQLYGLNPGMHHMTNLIFHILNSLLLFLLLKQMTGALWRSAIVAALFALHPINVESVAWVAERKNVLSALFWLLTMLAYVHYSRRFGLWRYLLALLMFILGLMCKPILVTLPFVLLLIDYWPLGRLRFMLDKPHSNRVKYELKRYDFKRPTFLFLVLEKIPFFILSAVSVYLSVLSARQHGIIASIDLTPITLRMANALVSYLVYIGKMIWPQNLAVFYPYPSQIPIVLTLGAGLTLLSISFLLIWVLRKNPYMGVGWLWYIGTLLPNIGLVQAGLWPSMADRWAYVPFIGIYIMITWGIAMLMKRWKIKKSHISAAAITIFLILTAITWFQVHHWANNFTLYKHAINVTVKNHVAHNNLGGALYLKGKTEEATTHFVTALNIMPDYNESLTNLRVSLGANTNIDQAIKKTEKLIKIYPENAGLYYNLGVMFRRKGELDKAIEHYKKALTCHTEFAQAQFDLAFIYSLKKEYEKAIASYRKTIEIRADLFWAYYNISAILSLQNRADESIGWLDQAIQRGFKNWDFLENDKKMKNIRRTSYYKNLQMN
jgi:tetratricopeptide (TPR) repeat protein